jgi:hypothetical protein
MVVHKSIKDFLQYLQAHPEIRSRIHAEEDRTLLYSGSFFNPMWKDIKARTDPALAGKQTLEDVLWSIALPGTSYTNLAAKVQDVIQKVDKDNVDARANRDILWRALSGIFASNARGKVSFQIGDGVSKRLDPTKQRNVFAATEIDVLLRNPHVSATTKDLLAYFKRCIQSNQADINLGFISA